jgi:DNA polymerase III subunit epsilon
VEGLTGWRRQRARNRPGLPPAVRRFLDASWPDAATPWRQVPFTVLDLETSGLDARKDVILAVGLVDVDGGRVRMDTAWRTLVAPPPGHVVGVPSIRIHGLLPGDLAEAPTLSRVLPVVARRLAGRVLAVHVEQVDRPFLDRAFREAWGVGLWMPLVDTARLALWFDDQPLLGGRGPLDRRLRLADLAAAFGVPVGREHDAMEDALVCAQVLLALATRLESMGRGTLGHLLKTGA